MGRCLTIEPRLGMSENNIFDYCSATPQKTNSFSNFHAMAFRNKIHFLPLILILFSCVENRIFIQLHPDGQTYFRFESRGDSADVFDQDFLHPRDFPGWATSAKVVEKDDNKNWIVSTEGLLQDTLILFFQGDEIPWDILLPDLHPKHGLAPNTHLHSPLPDERSKKIIQNSMKPSCPKNQIHSPGSRKHLLY